MVLNLRTFSFAESVEDDPTPPKNFSLMEIRVATHNFSHDNFIEEGTFDKVYWGRLADGLLGAVKRARFVDDWTKEIFEAEMQVGRMVSMHPNVLCLRGLCRTKKKILMVYPLICECSPAYYLRGRPDRSTRPLDWTTRKFIALGAARGLAHLHDQGSVKIMHREICTSTISLNAKFEAVIGRFSVCHYVNVNNPHICSANVSIAPEYWHTGKCTLKNDGYAYGKMPLELISGQSPFTLDMLEHDENLSLEEWIGGFMSKNEGKYMEEAEQLVRLAMLCSDGDPSVRPKMSEVVSMIESQMLGQDPNRRRNWSGSEHDSTPYYSFPPSPSLPMEIC
ncbi:hypothetical protein BT93_K1088 [Corymbia citriodora subsp. variegata]|nr:hypothetical protein BT93_K1088 [Corymbia citriodora subsp. variegata]